MRYKKNTVVLTLCLPIKEAKRVLNRLWACGCLSDKQYHEKMLKVDDKAFENEKRKQDTVEKLYSKVKKFYETEKK